MYIIRSLNLKNTYKVILFSIITLIPFLALGQSIIKKYEPVVFFTNRTKEVQELSDQLTKYKMVGIIGVSNIGKTELARRYAEVKRKQYNIIWFFDASVDLNEQFVLLAQNINDSLLSNSSIKISDNLLNAKKEVMQFLNQQDKWLLVFDNLKINSNYLVEDIIKWRHKGHIIICSQDDKHLINKVKVHKMNNQHSVQLVQKILKLDDKDKEKIFLAELTKILDGHPGMLVNSAFLLKEHKYLTMEEYKNILLKSDNPMTKHMEILFEILPDRDKQLLLYISCINNQFFSKNLLKIMLQDSAYIGEGLYNLSRFALIKQQKESNGEHFFEMHDAIKNSVLKFYSEDEIKNVIDIIVTNLNDSFPQNEATRQEFIKSDLSIKSNLEVLLDNAEQYQVRINTILGLRKSLADYYLANLDYYNVKLMKDWLDKKSALLSSQEMTDSQKINYGWYLVNIGIYEDFANSNFIEAMNYFKRAFDIMESVPGNYALKSTILMQMAQTQIYGGDIVESTNNMNKVDQLIKNQPNADYDMGLYWYIKAKIFLMEGKYQQALDAVDENIKADANITEDIFTAPTYMLQSEILNYQENYKESYDIITKIVQQEKDSGFEDHEVRARMLTQLSRAELGVGKIESAFVSAEEACKILQTNEYADSSNINVEYAAALVAKADALLGQNKFNDAMLFYSKAETVYLNRYGEHYQNLDDVAYLLFRGVRAAYENKNAFWRGHFCNQIRVANKNNRYIKKSLQYCH